MKNKPYIFIDGNHLSWRSFYLLGKKMGLGNHRDVSNAICYGFFNSFTSLMNEFNGCRIITCWDAPPYFRHQIYKEYKGQRPPKDDRFIGAMILCKQMLKEMGMVQLIVNGLEADDLAGIFTFLLDKKKESSLIVTEDQDYFQLLKKRVQLYRPNRKELYTVKDFKIDYPGFKPKDIILMKAIAGDKGDNIIGVDGVGPKTVLKIMSKYKTWKEVLANKEEIKKINAKCSKMFKSKVLDRIRLNRILVRIPNSDKDIERLVEQGHISKKRIKKMMKKIETPIQIKRKRLSKVLGRHGLIKFKRQVIAKSKDYSKLLGVEII